MRKLIENWKGRGISDREISTVLTNYFQGGAIKELSGESFENEEKSSLIDRIELQGNNILVFPQEGQSITCTLQFDYINSEFDSKGDGAIYIPKKFNLAYSIKSKK